MKHLLLDNPPGTDNRFNVGDDIQSLAAEQYLKNSPLWWPKQELGLYKGEDRSFISNGWFMHNADHWPPSSSLNPLYVSLHINENAKDIMLTVEGIEHLKEKGPIGCRDSNTVQILQDKDIPCYFSGCLTTTLKRSEFSQSNERSGIYVVDILYKLPHSQDAPEAFSQKAKKIVKEIVSPPIYRDDLITKILSPSLIEKANSIPHSLSLGDGSLEFRLAYAKTVLQKYADAKLVITSRIHCALPCLAFGTPVIFVNGGLSKKVEKCRLDGLTDWFHNISVSDQGDIENDFGNTGLLDESIQLENKPTYRKFAEELRQKCEAFAAT